MEISQHKALLGIMESRSAEKKIKSAKNNILCFNLSCNNEKYLMSEVWTIFERSDIQSIKI